MSLAPQDPLPPDRFAALLRRLSGDRIPGSEAPLAVYLSELDSWRRNVNLTGNLSAEELVLHTLEALVPLALIPHGKRLVDIGSGAGFPGLPIAIVRPDLDVALVEPRSKRAAFLRHVVRTLALSRVSVLGSRIEEVGGQTFDVATTRAVGDLPRLIGAADFLAPGGVLLLWTTSADDRALELAPWALERVIPIEGSSRRVVAAFRKPA